MKKIGILIIGILLFVNTYAQKDTVVINIDITKTIGTMNPFWAMFGCDEPNYTYMKDGKKLLNELVELSPVPVYFRCHHLMTTGDGTPALKWGSTNMYTEDSLGNPIYSWTIIDKIFDTFIERKIRPIAQIAFMPEALALNPHPYKFNLADANTPFSKGTGWSQPPKDYNKWSELIFQWVKHSVERYGKTEVETWYWELWNEPDAKFYLHSPDNMNEYNKMYDYASDAVKRALPTARIGAPHSTGEGTMLLNAFLNHVFREKNLVTGKVGSPIDYISFHAKGVPKVVNGIVQMGIYKQLKNIDDNFTIISSFPEAKNIPVIIGESDPEGCAACNVKTHPSNAYRNGTLYSSYTAASIARIYDLADYYKINLVGAVNWSFEFENQPWFYGYRELATNGVDKPVLNVFRMLGMMSGNRVEVSGNLAYNFKTIRDSSIRGILTDINAIASSDKNKVSILLWNYHDNDLIDAGKPIEVKINGLPNKQVTLTKYIIDQEHSNSYTVWKKMGSPTSPTTEQYSILEKSGGLEQLSLPEKIQIFNGQAIVKMQLPRQAVALLKFDY